MSRKHEIVGKDMAVADVVIQFCRKHKLGYRWGLNIEYLELSENKAKVFVEATGWKKGSYLTVDLRRIHELNIWQAFGDLTVHFAVYNDLPCGFTSHTASFQVVPDPGDYKFEDVKGYDQKS